MMKYGEAFVDAPPLAKVPASLGMANIQSLEAAPVAKGGLERSSADEAGSIPWSEAVSLLRAGEIETYVTISDTELLVTLCSGRGVLTKQPKTGAILEVSPPKIICGKETALVGQ